jgi:hypothetical protein
MLWGLRMRIIAGACLATCSAVAFTQTPAQFDSHAREVASRSPLVYRAVHPVQKGTQWARYEVAVNNIKWDVKKTDSLITPVVAIVRADLAFASTAPEASQDLANSAAIRPPKELDRIELIYRPSDNGWQWSSGRFALTVLNRWDPITPGDGGLPKDPQMRWIAEQFMPSSK